MWEIQKHGRGILTNELKKLALHEKEDRDMIDNDGVLQYPNPTRESVKKLWRWGEVLYYHDMSQFKSRYRIKLQMKLLVI